MECVVCFANHDLGASCSNGECDARVCRECVNAIVEFSMNQSFPSMPRCPMPDCDGEFWFSHIKHLLSKDKMAGYSDLCEKCIGVDAGSIDRLLKQQMVDSIRAKKMEAITRFPVAIQMVIEIALQAKLNEVSKKNKKKIDIALNKFKESIPMNPANVGGYQQIGNECIKADCDGTVVDSICTKCAAIVCTQCRQERLGLHVCKDEDLKSIDTIKKMVRCPTCKLPVEKSMGCTFITCAVCRTKFNYRTGKEEIYGNHDDRVIKPRSSSLMVKIDEYNAAFESVSKLEPKYSPINPKLGAAKRYEIFATNKRNKIYYTRYMQTLIDSNSAGTLSIGALRELFEKIQIVAK